MLKGALLASICLFIGVLAMSGSNYEGQYENPVFYIDFSISDVVVDVRLNDISVYDDSVEGVASSEKPIPESIVNGPNALLVRVLPLNEGDHYPASAYVDIKLVVRGKDAPAGSGEPVIHLRVEPKAGPDGVLDKTLDDIGDNEPKLVVYSEKGEIVAERSSNIDSPYPQWEWQNGQRIEKNHENFDSLMKVYDEVYSALKNGDMREIKDLYAPAAKEYAEAYGYNDPSEGHRIMNTGGLVEDSEWVLADINRLRNKMRYELDVFADGRLARILDQDGRSPIMYLNTEVKMLNIQKFAFYKNNDNEWVMIR